MRNATGPKAQEVVVDIIEELKDVGKQEALSSMLLDQLAHRFGPVPADAKKRILEADVRKLRRRALRGLDAASIQEVLGKPTARRASAR